MIERAVMSYWTGASKGSPHRGWLSERDHHDAWRISSNLLARHFREVVLVTDRAGWAELSPLALPFAKVSLELEKIDPKLARIWSWGKVVAYGTQTQPFVHVDTDAFMFRPLPLSVLEAPVCAHIPDKFWRTTYASCYPIEEMLAKVRRLPSAVRRAAAQPIQYAASCGLYGGNDIGTIQLQWHLANECLELDPDGWASLAPIAQIHLLEQWMVGVALRENRSWIEYLYPSCSAAIDERQQREVGFVHLWGPEKRHLQRVRNLYENGQAT